MTEVIIVGCGLSGIVLSRLLKKRGVESIILEKSKGVGGRIATRRIEDLGFDHGAPYLRADQALLDLLAEAGLETKSAVDPNGIYLRGGLNQFTKALSVDLTIHREKKVLKLSGQEVGWSVETEDGATYAGKKVILSAPLPQSLELLQRSGVPFHPKLSAVAYHKAILALVIAEASLFDRYQNSSVATVLPMEGRGLHPKGYVVTATEEFSEKNFDLPDLELLEKILPPASAHAVSHAEVKKWRYSRPVASLEDSFHECDGSLFLCGDAFLSPDATGALGSARALAERLTRSLGS